MTFQKFSSTYMARRRDDNFIAPRAHDGEISFRVVALKTGIMQPLISALTVSAMYK